MTTKKSNLYKTIRTIILSRIKKTKNDKWIQDRRNICSVCPKNTKNMSSVSLKIKLIKALSNFYTWILFKPKTNFGNCSICGCDVFYSTREKESECSDDPPKWKSIYFPNDAQKEKWINDKNNKK